MPDSFYDTMVVLFFTVVPVVLLLSQILLSTRKRIIWGFIVPLLWSILGAWILIRGYLEDKKLSFEMLIVFLVSDIILFGILILARYLKSKKRNKSNRKSNSKSSNNRKTNSKKSNSKK